MQSDCKKYFVFAVEEFSGIMFSPSFLTAGHFVYLTVWSPKNRELGHARRICPLQIQNNFKNRFVFLNKQQILSIGSQLVSTTLSVEIRSKNFDCSLMICIYGGGGRNRIGRREKWPKKSWEEGEIGGKSREEGEIGSESREKGDLPPCSPPYLACLGSQSQRTIWFILPARGASHIINMGYWPSVRSRWLDIGQVLFYMFIDRDEVKVHNSQKKNDTNIHSSWPNKLGR